MGGESQSCAGEGTASQVAVEPSQEVAHAEIGKKNNEKTADGACNDDPHDCCPCGREKTEQLLYLQCPAGWVIRVAS